MTDKRRVSIKRRKSVYAKGWGVKSRDNSVTLWYAGSRTWKKVENNRVSDKKSLVARSNKRCGKICRWKRCDSSDLWQIVQNDAFCGNNRRNISKRTGKVFRDNVWKLYGLPESIVLNRWPQFVVEMIKELNNILRISQISYSLVVILELSGVSEV